LQTIGADGDFWRAVAGIISAGLTPLQRHSALATLNRLARLFDVPPTELIRHHGMRLINHRQYQSATEAFALLVDLAPADAEAYKSLGVALQGVGFAEDAMIAWQMGQQLAH